MYILAERRLCFQAQKEKNAIALFTRGVAWHADQLGVITCQSDTHVVHLDSCANKDLQICSLGFFTLTVYLGKLSSKSPISFMAFFDYFSFFLFL
jgi:hypothetical protein